MLAATEAVLPAIEVVDSRYPVMGHPAAALVWLAAALATRGECINRGLRLEHPWWPPDAVARHRFDDSAEFPGAPEAALT